MNRSNEEQNLLTKLCLVIPSLQAGGMERVMSELALYFSEVKKVEVHIVLYGITREIFYKLPGNVIVHMPAFRFDNRLRFINTVRTGLFLRKKVNEVKPNSVLSFGEIWNSFVLLFLFRSGYKIYISDRCSPARKYSTIHSFLRRFLYPSAAGIVAQTSTAKEIYSAMKLNSNIEVIGNPVRQIEQKGNMRGKTVLSVGRLIKTKNHDKLIELFVRVRKPGWSLVIAGYDHMKEENESTLRDLIKRNKAEEFIVLAGKVSDIDNLYLSSALFAFMSETEGFPNVIGEAMSAGLPVVAFDCIAGPSDMIDDGRSGYLVPLYDYGLFGRRLADLMADETLRNRIGENARKSIGRFSAENMGKLYFEFITGINKEMKL